MSEVKNALFIMCDQLRWDYLQHAGHPHIRTPALDAFTRRATRFSQCYVQAPVCGGSRMSFYTGRYAYSHGAHYNNFPLRIDERGLGDYLSEVGVHTSLIGKTHMKADDAALERLGVDPGSDIGRRVRQVGFDAIERDDGLHPEVTLRANLPYNAYLRSHGYLGRNPWHEYANSAAGPNGEILSGWHMRHANRPARVHRDHSETAYMTDRALDFLSVDRAEPWCLHLSYIKPHWPYIAPEPYHRMYGPDEILRANRTAAERAAPHPVVHAFMQHDESVSFASQECRETVIPTYMGLISEIDDHFARLIAHLEDSGRLDDTMVIFTSDHGDYLGDHWLGEKDLFHDEVVRVPMIIYDPSRAADATRGETIEQFVEAIDIVPTLLEALGGEPARTSLDGRSLLPLMRGSDAQKVPWRDAVFSDSHYGVRHARRTLGIGAERARAFMVRTTDWKYVEYPGFAPQLFDLRNDPSECVDLGCDPHVEPVRREMKDRLYEWFLARSMRTNLSAVDIEERTGSAHARGYLFGLW